MQTVLKTTEPVVTTFNVWVVALALTRGVRLIGTTPGRWTMFALDNADGRASQALEDWRYGRATVSVRDFVETYRDVQRMAHASI